MCIAIIKKRGVSLPTDFDEQIRASAYTNSDGVGYAFWRNGTKEIKVLKGFINRTEDFIKEIELLEVKPEDVLLVHARSSTSGQTNDENSHPFIISKDINECVLTDTTTKKPVMIHNGIFSKYTNHQSLYSDTCHFANSYLTIPDTMYLIKHHPELVEGYKDVYLITDKKLGKVKKFMNDFGGKVAILFADGTIFTYGNFTEENGMLYSNACYKSRYYKNRGGVNSFTENEVDEITAGWNSLCRLPAVRRKHKTVKYFDSNDKTVESIVDNIENFKESVAFVSNTPKVLNTWGSFKYTGSPIVETGHTVFLFNKYDDRLELSFYINGTDKYSYTRPKEEVISLVNSGAWKIIGINKENDININSIYQRQLYENMLKNPGLLVALEGKELRIYTKKFLYSLFKKFWDSKSHDVKYFIGKMDYKNVSPDDTIKFLKFLGAKHMIEDVPASGTTGFIRHNPNNNLFDTFDFQRKDGSRRIIFVSPKDLIRTGSPVSMTRGEDTEKPLTLDEAMGVKPVYN